MAAAIPVITTFAGAAASGGIAAGLGAVGALAASGIGGFLTVAGGVLGGMGALSGDKTFKRVGALMSLGGGLMTSLGIGQSVGDASAGSAEAADQVYQGADTASDAVNRAATNSPFQSAQDAPALGSQAAGDTVGYPDAIEQQRASLFDRSMGAERPLGGNAPLVERAGGGQLGSDPAGGGIEARGPLGKDPLQAAGSRLSSSDIAAAARTATQDSKSALASLSRWINENKGIAQIGGNMLANMFGPQAEQIDMEKSIVARRLRNLNQPIRLGPSGP